MFNSLADKSATATTNENIIEQSRRNRNVVSLSPPSVADGNSMFLMKHFWQKRAKPETSETIVFEIKYKIQFSYFAILALKAYFHYIRAQIETAASLHFYSFHQKLLFQ